MSPRSFWILLLKLVGVWIMFSSITVVPQFISSLWPVFSSHQIFDNWEVLLILLLTLLIYLWIFRVLIFRPDTVIDKLKLDKGFDEERLEFNIHRSTVVTIAIIIIGGLMIIDSIPLLFRTLFMYLQSQTTPYTNSTVTPTWIFVYLCKTLIGYLLIANNRVVVNFIEKTRRVQVEEVGEAEKDEADPADTEETQSS